MDICELEYSEPEIEEFLQPYIHEHRESSEILPHSDTCAGVGVAPREWGEPLLDDDFDGFERAGVAWTEVEEFGGTANLNPGDLNGSSLLSLTASLLASFWVSGELSLTASACRL